MMARTHAVSAIPPALAVGGAVFGLAGLDLAAFAVCAAGAALINDLDHPDSTIARTFGPLTVALAHAVRWASGGHRRGTHCLLGIALIGAAFGYAAGYPLAARVGATLLLGLALDAVLAGTSLIKSIARFGASWAAVWALTGYGLDWWWLGWAAALGALAHSAGDSLTPGGVPWFYPFSRRRYAIPITVTNLKLREAWRRRKLPEAAIRWACVATAGLLLAGQAGLLTGAPGPT
jgi:membrane-bound metal-dependent hydrolase YbcI (DUF457 family)